MAQGVYYEFIEKNHHISIVTENLLDAWELKPGKEYLMIVSDFFGLKRYNTQDVFLCKDNYLNIPNLAFKERINLSFSFTGEKITGNQMSLLYNKIFHQFFPEKYNEGKHPFITCIPIEAKEESPYYEIFIFKNSENFKNLDILQRIERFANEEFPHINAEYAEKVSSGRLGPFKVSSMTQQYFLKKVLDEKADSWESQFKFLPLYKKPWKR